MTSEQVTQIAEKHLQAIQSYYGLSRHQATYPYLCIEDSPYSDAEDPTLKGEFCRINNEIVVYWKNVNTEEDIIRTIIHEYQHYLQSPAWFTRYYNQGYGYSDHPYEVQASEEEDNWGMFI